MIFRWTKTAGMTGPIALALALFAGPRTRADLATAPQDPTAEFALARTAYDAGNLASAIAHYESLLRAGFEGPEIRFNLGNALFRSGDAPGAIYEYAKALRFRPRDPDILKNLGFALEKTGAITPTLSFPEHLARRLSENEWRRLAMAGWGIAGGFAMAAFMARRGRTVFRGIAGFAAAIAVLAFAGAAVWRELEKRPEAVVFQADAAVRFAPLPDATVHFSLPVGSIVRVMGRDGAWIRVRLDGREGWIPDSALRVL